jgi:hypothetical protein
MHPGRMAVVDTRQFGPVKFSQLRRLTDFKFLSITDDGDDRPRLRMYNVTLCGGRGTRPILFTSFGKREEANSFARELGTALKLPAKDYVGTEPHADENY